MGTVFVGGGVILVIFLAVRSLYKDKKSGKNCNGQCGGCKGCH
nr:FeoB-associated Cys-rich membrane protein [Frisingicoccus sp.]